MKKSILILIFICINIKSYSQSLGLGTDAPDVSAIFEANSNDRGILLPRIALTGVADAITVPTPAKGLLVWNNALGGWGTEGYYYNDGTPALPNWTRIANEDPTIDWTVATTANTPAITTDHQYVTGNVGIGNFSTLVPAERLEVLNGNAQITGVTNGQIPSLNIYGGDGSNGVSLNSNQQSRINFWEPDGKGSWGMYMEHFDDDGFFTPTRGAGALLNHIFIGSVKAGTYTPIMSLNDGNTYTGRVGIGTTDPDAKLEVRGNTNGLGGIKISNIANQAHSWIPYINGSIFLTGDVNSGIGDIYLRSYSGTTYTNRISINGTSGIVDIEKGVLFDCNNCGDPATLDGTGDYGDLTIQGRVLSASNNLHLSPPNGFNVVINDTYRAAGGTGGGSAGLHVEGNVGIALTNPSNKLDVNGYLEIGNQSSGGADVEGAMRYNTVAKCVQFFDGSVWKCIGEPNMQSVTIRDGINETANGGGSNIINWGGSYGVQYPFTVNNVRQNGKVLFLVEMVIGTSDKRLNDAFNCAYKISGNGVFGEKDVPAVGSDETLSSFVWGTPNASGNLNFVFECNTNISDVKVTAIIF